MGGSENVVSKYQEYLPFIETPPTEAPAPATKPAPKPVAGNWGAWSPFTTCSRMCGGGVQSRMRACDNPPPSMGEPTCKGSPQEDRACNTQPCAGMCTTRFFFY